MKKLFWLPVVLCCLCIAACSRRPDNVLSEGKMADVLADLSIADQLALRNMSENTDFGNDSARKILRQSIMRKNGVTEAQFDSTLVWYGHHMDDYSKLYKKVEERLADRQTALNKRSGMSGEDKDNLWPLPSMLSFSDKDLNQGFSFSVPGSKIKLGKALVWKLRTNGIYGNAVAFIGAEYTNMEMVYTRMTLGGGSSQQLVLNLERDRKPKRIIGYVRFTTPPTRRVFLDSLALTQQSAATVDYAARSNQIHLKYPEPKRPARPTKPTTDSTRVASAPGL